jgi:Fe-S-cluster-containing dehydrogenase component
MTISRRNFLKVAGAAGGVLLAGGAKSAQAAQTPQTSAGGVEFNGMLIDTTKCIGCRACEEACNEANKLPKPKVSFSSESVFEETRDTTTGAFTVLNRFPNEKKPDAPIFVRKQCMHCNQPACASACLCRAMEKTKEAAVIYHKDRCMGCRYCMVACPFDIPKFEYNSPTPFVWKCIFCNERQKKGEQPACSEVCPTGATLFGKKRDLLEIAKTRIYTEPDKYVHKIYGEHEVGGTGWLFLMGAPEEKLGLKTNLPTTPYPELTSGFLYGVPLVFVLWPSLLIGLNYLIKDSKVTEKKEASHDEQD